MKHILNRRRELFTHISKICGSLLHIRVVSPLNHRKHQGRGLQHNAQPGATGSTQTDLPLSPYSKYSMPAASPSALPQR
ncbi:hypothetical protein [Paenibacillus sp. J22TS3]|uniref:hypothetical protein n=1 Tax=Paenibacillus sp. J22TS3 TaxID=2807192 RepID=UPI001BCBBC07|nr:hypothetical protein [Paenibacillus sp. J22TS3]